MYTTIEGLDKSMWLKASGSKMELLSTQSIQESEDRNKTSTTSSLYLQNNVCFGFRNLFPRDILFSSSF